MDRTGGRPRGDPPPTSARLLQEERRAREWRGRESTCRETCRNLHRTGPRNRRENIPRLPRTLPQDTSHIFQGKITRRIREFRDRPTRSIAGQDAHSSPNSKGRGKTVGVDRLKRPLELRAAPRSWRLVLKTAYPFLAETGVRDLLVFGSQALSVYLKSSLRSKDLDLVSSQ